MFDHMSNVDRKNPLGSIVAFRDACRMLPPDRSARLRIKCHANTPAAVLGSLRTAAGDAPIEIIADTLDEAGMDALWQQCDCLLSLHRSEGFGLPVAEALSRAIPVIATRQGGILDFADDAGCFLVSGPAAAAGPRSGPYPEWTGWIEPDLTEAAHRMIDVVTDYSQASQRASAGQSRIRHCLSPEQVRRQFDGALGACREKRG
jgi:glycosyltransferase involved in cell wall biosynthesis